MRAILRRIAYAINGGSPDTAPAANNVSALDTLDGLKG